MNFRLIATRIGNITTLWLWTSGSVFKNAMALGDVDNDGNDELVVANQNGELSIFKGMQNRCWYKAAELGMVINFHLNS